LIGKNYFFVGNDFISIAAILIKMRRPYLVYIAIFSLLTFSRCSDHSSGNGELVFVNNMDMLVAFNPSTPRNIVPYKNAHSGMFVCIVDSENVFSVNYEMKNRNISNEPLKRVKVGAWINMQQEGSDPNLAIDIRDSSGKTLDWIAVNSKDLSKKTMEWQWMELTVDLTVKKRNAPENSLRIYAFNQKGASCLVDDMEVRYEK